MRDKRIPHSLPVSGFVSKMRFFVYLFMLVRTISLHTVTAISPISSHHQTTAFSNNKNDCLSSRVCQRKSRSSFGVRHKNGRSSSTPVSRGGSLSLEHHSSDKGSGLVYNSTEYPASIVSLMSLASTLETDLETGLTSSQVESRIKQFGENTLQTPPGKSLWKLILEQFEDRLVQILLAVAALSGVFSYMEHLEKADHGATSIWQSFVEPLVILSILILNAAVGVWQSRSAEGSLEALKQLQPSLASVLRNGVWEDGVDAAQLVPGDIISFRVGDKIPADARLLSLKTSSLSVDEGSLTGESATVQKDTETLDVEHNAPLQDLKNTVFSGTMVTSGSGTAIVVRTGMDTEIGKIQKGVTQAKSEEIKTPLGQKLDEFGDTLTVIIGVICLAVWVISIPKFNDAAFANTWEGAIYYAKVAVALGVAAIPEGLPAVITLCLSLGTRRMAKRNVIVRKLPSVETLGCTSVICTDKTGTLTTNEMTAVSLVLLERNSGAGMVVEHPISCYSYSPIGLVSGITPGEEIRANPYGSVADVAAVAALCNDAKIVGNDNAILEGGKSKKKKKKTSTLETIEKEYERVGEPTEAALCILAEKLGGMSHATIDKNNENLVPPSILASANVNGWRSAFPRSATLEFSRDRKSMSVLCRPDSDDRGKSKGGNQLLVKGAPNLLLQRCTHVKFRDGTVTKLTGQLRRSIEAKTSELAVRPLRCLALAVKETRHLDRSLKSYCPDDSLLIDDNENKVNKHPLLSDPSKYSDIESGLTLVGIVGIKDPPRPEVKDSINQCTAAGIRVMMITGDAKDTAVAIARDVNIFPPTDDSLDVLKAYEGREFFDKTEVEQLDLLKSGNIVFCRAEPADKQKLVKMLQSLGEIPAMTGDGVNDAPALQQAAIGIAMGITGTEVSKEAADMVLADDNFSTIVNAVEEGRCIYANMQAFICFLISCNIGEIFAILLATISGFPEPLTAMHLLWVNLVTDGPPATALGFNPAAPDLMKQPPRPSDEPIMTKWLLTRYCVTGLYVGLATVGVFVGHYLKMGITLSNLSSWGKCGELWTPSNPALSCDELFHGGKMLPQTLSLTTLVCMEMFKALSAVSVDNSIFTVGPQKNIWLILGVTFPFLLHIAVLYSEKLGLPALGSSFGVVALSLENWKTVLQWSAPILLVDEILKAIGRWLQKSEKSNED